MQTQARPCEVDLSPLHLFTAYAARYIETISYENSMELFSES